MSLSQQERTYRRLLAAEGLPLPDSTSKRRGVSVPGLRGAAPRFLERDAQIAALRSQGLAWTVIGPRFGMSARAAKHAATAHAGRQQ